MARQVGIAFGGKGSMPTRPFPQQIDTKWGFAAQGQRRHHFSRVQQTEEEIKHRAREQQTRANLLLGGMADVARALACVGKYNALRGHAQTQHHVKLQNTN